MLKDNDIKLQRIQNILNDDENYQTVDLKLGGIWSICTEGHYFVRHSGYIKVMPKEKDNAK